MKLVRKDVKKHFYNIKVVNEWIKLSDDNVKADSIWKLKKLYNNKIQEMRPHKFRNPSLYGT